VHEVTLDAFLARHIETSASPESESQRLAARFETLRDAIRESLDDVRVVRHFGVEVRCLVLGNDPATGEIAGLATVD
jgi:hypothetical protein